VRGPGAGVEADAAVGGFRRGRHAERVRRVIAHDPDMLCEQLCEIHGELPAEPCRVATGFAVRASGVTSFSEKPRPSGSLPARSVPTTFQFSMSSTDTTSALACAT